jgi:hypothetical protein
MRMAMGHSNLALTNVSESGDPTQLSHGESPERIRDSSTISDHQKTLALNSVVLTLVMDEFVLDESEKQDLIDCAEEVIQGNGAEWVWQNREMLFDLLEFHGYTRQSH